MYALALAVALATPAPQPGQRSHPAPIRWGAPLPKPTLLKPRWSRSFRRSAAVTWITAVRTTNTIVVVADGLIGIDPRTGATKWSRRGITRPIAARDGYVVATRGNATVLLNERGSILWSRDLCGAAPLSYAMTATRVLTICATQVVASTLSGMSTITQREVNETATENQWVDPWTEHFAFAHFPFSGAWSGTNARVLDMQRGQLLPEMLNAQPASDLNPTPFVSVDTLAFHRLNVYEPVQIGQLDASRAEVKTVKSYAPDPQIYALGDNVMANAGTAYVIGPWLYAGVGHGLYRYRVDGQPNSPELLADVDGQALFGNDIAFTFVRGSDGAVRIVKIAPLSGTPVIHALPLSSEASFDVGAPLTLYEVGTDNAVLRLGSRTVIVSFVQRRALFATDSSCNGFPAQYLASDAYPAIGCPGNMSTTLYGFALAHRQN